MEQIVLIGGGGHAHSVLDSIKQTGKYHVAGFVEREISNSQGIAGVPVIGTDDDLQAIYDSGIQNAFITIGYLGKSDTRERIYHNLKKIGYKVPIIIDPSSIIAYGVSIHEGTFVGKRVVINANAEIGKMCIVNTGAIIEHDDKVEDFTHVSVGSVLCGGVSVGSRSLIGANATVIQNVHIADDVIVGAGVTVRHDLESGKTFYGK